MVLPVISHMRVTDLDYVLTLERRCFGDPWTRRMYLSDLTDNELATYLVLRPSGLKRSPSRRDDGLETLPPLLAYGGFWMMTDEAHIATLASHPECRGCGLGAYLMLAMLTKAQERGAAISTLEVRASNLPAQQLYLKLGYQIQGSRHHYYRDGEDGLIMTTPALADPAMRSRLDQVFEEASARLGACFDPGNKAPLSTSTMPRQGGDLP